MYRVEQKIHGHTYVYEVTSYWDAKKKQSRQKRVYIGRKDPKTGEIVDTKRESSKPIDSPEFVIGTPKSGFLGRGLFLVPALERASL
jgi:hypothetical protein